MQATIQPMQRCGRNRIELTFSENPVGEGGSGVVWKGVTPIFFVRERVAFSAMGSLTSVCRGLKKFPKGWYEKSGRKKIESPTRVRGHRALQLDLDARPAEAAEPEVHWSATRQVVTAMGGKGDVEIDS